MVSLIIQTKIFVKNVRMVVKLAMIKDMINVLLVTLIQIIQFFIKKGIEINVFKHVQLDNMDKNLLIGV